MKVVVDFDACACHALCTAAAPDVFEISNEGILEVKLESPPESMRPAVEQAARDCPTRAISLES